MFTALLFAFGFLGMFLAGGLVCYAWQRRVHVSAPPAPLRQAQDLAAVPLVFLRQWRPMTPEQWAIAFRAWPDTDERWRALWDLLAHHLEAELSEMQGAKPDPHEIVQRSGRLQMLLFLRAQILNLKGSRE